MLNLQVTGFKGLAKLDPQGLTVKVNRHLQAVWREAMREFVETAARNMAVDTGMSIATFRPLAAEVRMKGLLEAIIRGKGIRRTESSIYSSYQFPGPREPKSASLGERMGRTYKYTFRSEGKNPRFEFTFDIPVLQFYLHENGLGARNSHAYNALSKGSEAFMATWLDKAPAVITSTLINELRGI